MQYNLSNKSVFLIIGSVDPTEKGLVFHFNIILSWTKLKNFKNTAINDYDCVGIHVYQPYMYKLVWSEVRALTSIISKKAQHNTTKNTVTIIDFGYKLVWDPN